MSEYIVEMRHITKRFPGIIANDDVSIGIRKGEVYALLGGNIYYDTEGIIRQNTKAMSVLSASLRKEFKLGPVHLDHRALFQLSSEPEVLPLPTLALNFRYYLEFVVQRNERRQNVMTMQIGADAYTEDAASAAQKAKELVS